MRSVDVVSPAVALEDVSIKPYTKSVSCFVFPGLGIIGQEPVHKRLFERSFRLWIRSRDV
jgi:hypothetical protein